MKIQPKIFKDLLYFCYSKAIELDGNSKEKKNLKKLKEITQNLSYEEREIAKSVIFLIINKL